MKKKIIILGATGRIGAYLSTALCREYDIIAVGRRENDNGFFADYGILYISGDITDPRFFDKLPQKDVYAILDFAGPLSASMEGYDPYVYVDGIFKATLNVLEYMRRTKIERIIFPQSLYDIKYLWGTKTPIPADSQRIAPYEGDHSVYVIAKNAAVDLIEHYHTVFGIKRFIFRLPRIYLYSPVPYFYEDGEKVMISDHYLIEQAMKGEDLEVWGDPKRLLETIDVRDLIQLVEKALLVEHSGGIYNAASGGSTLEERILGIMEVFNPNPKAKVTYCPEKRPARQFTLDYLKAVNELGYRPKYKWKDYLYSFKKEMEQERFAKIWGRKEDYAIK